MSCGNTDTGTENESFILPSASTESGSASPARCLVVDTHRYIVGMSSTGSGTSTSGASEPSRVDCTTAGVAETGVRSSAVDSTLRLFFDLLCFLSKRLIVSAYPTPHVHMSNPQVFFDRVIRTQHTFSSSSFFSVRFLRLRAVSSRRNAISDSVSCFFLREDSAVVDISLAGLWTEGDTDRGRHGMSRPH